MVRRLPLEQEIVGSNPTLAASLVRDVGSQLRCNPALAGVQAREPR